ncbi:MAG: hypothetical protein AABZ12_09455 [Planctomycetota bacterium]
MQICFHCPTNGCVALIEYEPLEECGPTMRCPRCKKDIPITVTDAVRARRSVDRCAVCGCSELFVRKDFPQGLGLAVVVLFGAAAVYCFTFSVVWAWAVLASAFLLDFLIYLLIGRVTTCYRCRAEFRKSNQNPEHEGFDLSTSEKY